MLIDAFLEGEVKIREELTLQESGVFDSAFDASFDQGVCFDGQKALAYAGAYNASLLYEVHFNLTWDIPNNYSKYFAIGDELWIICQKN